MNKVLLEEIVKHILAELLVIPSGFVNAEKSKSLLSKEFLLPKMLTFELEGGSNLNNNVWGCQLSAEDRELKILLGDCSREVDVKEYCLIVQLKNAPAYGLYLVYAGKDVPSEPLIACSVDKTGWLECSTYLQATFLAGMEQIKDINFKWNKCSNYEDQFELLKSFIQYHDLVYGDNE